MTVAEYSRKSQWTSVASCGATDAAAFLFDSRLHRDFFLSPGRSHIKIKSRYCFEYEFFKQKMQQL